MFHVVVLILQSGLCGVRCDVISVSNLFIGGEITYLLFVVLILMSNHVLDVFNHQNRQIAHEYGINCPGRNFIIISVGFPLVVKEDRDSHFHINEK